MSRSHTIHEITLSYNQEDEIRVLREGEAWCLARASTTHKSGNGIGRCRYHFGATDMKSLNRQSVSSASQGRGHDRYCAAKAPSTSVAPGEP
jgi:hypothetical protein